MSTTVMRDQFEIKDGAIIHTPTGAEFTPVRWPLNKPPVSLSEEDLLALRTYAGERRQKSTDPEPNGGYEY